MAAINDVILRMIEANRLLGSWMAAALDDPTVCDEMKEDINTWFEAMMALERAYTLVYGLIKELQLL